MIEQNCPADDSIDLDVFRTIHRCCVCSYTTHKTYNVYTFRLYTFPQKLDLRNRCRGGCGHRSYIRFRSELQTRVIKCWVCGVGQEPKLLYSHDSSSEEGSQPDDHDDDHADDILDPEFEPELSENCGGCEHELGSECVREWKSATIGCECLGKCFWDIKTQGERGHICTLLEESDADDDDDTDDDSADDDNEDEEDDGDV